MQKLRQLAEEDPQLHITWSEALGEIHVQLMGQVQLEILQRMIRQRFGWEVTFGPGQHRLPGDHRRSGGGHRPL